MRSRPRWLSYSPLSGTGPTAPPWFRYTPLRAKIWTSPTFRRPRYAETPARRLFGRRLHTGHGNFHQSAVVNHTFAETYYPGQTRSAGASHRWTRTSLTSRLSAIGDLKYDSAKEKADRAAYRPFSSTDQQTYNTVRITDGRRSIELAGEVRAAIAQVDDKLPVLSVTRCGCKPMNPPAEKIAGTTRELFGLLGLVLSCVGLYGIMAHAVVRRTNEIGIRMALGARRGNIVLMVLGRVYCWWPGPAIECRPGVRYI